MIIGASNREQMTAPQREAYDEIASGPRGHVPAPFLAMLDAPNLAKAIQAVGAIIRYESSIPDELRELAILATAAAFGSAYEWNVHAEIARRVGVAEELIAATQAEEPRTGLDRTSELIIALCRAAVHKKIVPKDILAELVEIIGRQAASEIVAITGYYPLLGLFILAGDLDNYPI